VVRERDAPAPGESLPLAPLRLDLGARRVHHREHRPAAEHGVRDGHDGEQQYQAGDDHLAAHGHDRAAGHGADLPHDRDVDEPAQHPMMRARAKLRPGFTLVEMLVALTILSLFGAAVTKILVVQTRLFSKAAAQRGNRSVTRSAMNMIDSDLRMVEATH